MRLSIASDLHLEFGPLLLDNTENTDVLVLAGDIFVAKALDDIDRSYVSCTEQKQAKKIIDFFGRAREQWDDIILIFGNHEYYGSTIGDGSVERTLRKMVKLEGVHVLDPGTVTIGGVKFIGATMWTEFRNRDPMVMHHAMRSMNDFNLITISDPVRKIRPLDIAKIHKDEMMFMWRQLDNTTNPVVVVTHHAPTSLSIADEWKGDMINDAYEAGLGEFILDNPHIKLWVHGHTHHCVDYMVGETRVVSNQRGYAGHQKMADSFELLTVEV